MIEEVGVIQAVYGDMAEVVVTKQDDCKGCSSNKMCHAFSRGDGKVLIKAVNEAHASANQRVIVAISSETYLMASAVMYLIPIVGMLCGMLIGHFTPSSRFSPDEMSFFFGLLGLAVSIFCVKIFNLRFENNASIIPKITRVL